MNSPHRIPFWLRAGSWIGVVIWASTIFYFSSLTVAQIEQIGLTFWDKAMHFIAFFAGGWITVLAMKFSTKWSFKKVFLVSSMWLIVYGALDELHQLRTPNRAGADPLDWLADALGGMTGSFLTLLIYVFIERTYFRAPARD